MALARIDIDRDLVDTRTHKLVVKQKTASYSKNYMLNSEKALKKYLKVQKGTQSNFINQWRYLCKDG